MLATQLKIASADCPVEQNCVLFMKNLVCQENILMVQRIKHALLVRIVMVLAQLFQVLLGVPNHVLQIRTVRRAQPHAHVIQDTKRLTVYARRYHVQMGII